MESNLDKKLLNDYGIALKNGSAVLTVADLIEIQEIRLNDYMKMEFSGFEGDGYAYISTDYEKLKSDVETQVRALAGGAGGGELYFRKSLAIICIPSIWMYSRLADSKTAMR